MTNDDKKSLVAFHFFQTPYAVDPVHTATVATLAQRRGTAEKREGHVQEGK